VATLVRCTGLSERTVRTYLDRLEATRRDGSVTARILEIFVGFGGGETADTCALFLVTRLMSIGFGMVVFTHPNLGACPPAAVGSRPTQAVRCCA
jgi:hypothetical protein